MQHLLIHADETDGTPHSVALSLDAPNTAWIAVGRGEDEYLAGLEEYRARGYGLRRVNAFQTRQGMRYATIWEFGAAMPKVVRHAMSHADFRNTADVASARGYELTHIDGCATRGGARFAAIWDEPSGRAQKVITDLTAGDFHAHTALAAESGFRPKQVAGYASNGDARFAAVFTQDTKSAVARVALPATEFYGHMQAMTSRGHALTDASGYVVGGAPMFTAVWEKA